MLKLFELFSPQELSIDAAFMSPLSIRLLDTSSKVNNSKPPLAVCEINNLSTFLIKTKQPAVMLPGKIIFVCCFSFA